MKILHIMAGRGQGGAETYSTDVMLSLHQAGVKQCVVMSKKAPRYEELRRAGIDLAPGVLSIPFKPLQRLFMRLLIARWQPDIIQCWMRRAASLIPTTNIPTIGWFGGYYDPRHFKRCKYFVGVTKDIVAHMVRNGVGEKRAHFIPTFPDITAQPPADRTMMSTPKDVPVLLALSRLHPKKGLDTLLNALKELPECYVWLAGEGPLRRELEAQAKSLGVIDRVRFLGWRTDRAALLRAADICVFPSRYEPFGTVTLEAWAAGTPLVACKSAGPAATITHGVDGLLVEIDDAHGIAEAVKSILADENMKRQLVAQGYAAYIKGYTREAVTQQWLQYYNALLKHS
ncbi:MAG TPA: glycosyltransferase [Alphaproteobacteria bacterium]|nr:glycosyltransferase [Alphaproteobacteria bacterium]